MHPSLFKVPSKIPYWLWVICPMGKRTLISKGGTCSSAVFGAAVRVLRLMWLPLGCIFVYLWVPLQVLSVPPARVAY